MDDLLALPGVGRKTANLVRNFGFVNCVDHHVHRISNRMGWVTTRTPEQITALMEILPARGRIGVNELLVRYGQAVCTPVLAAVQHLSRTKYCARTAVGKSR